MSQLEEYARLESNWDSYGGETITAGAIDASRALILKTLSSLASPLRLKALDGLSVAPTADGGVGLEWDIYDRSIDVAINPDGSLSYLRVDRSDDGAQYFERHQVPPEEVVAQIFEIMAIPSNG